MLYAIIGSDILMALVFGLSLSHLPPQIPIFYSRQWGEDQLIDTWLIFMLPLISHIFIFINSYIYNKIFLPDQFFKRIIDGVSWFVLVASAITFIRIILFIS